MTAPAPGRLVGGEPDSVAAQAGRLAAGADILDALATRVGATVAAGWSGVAAHHAAEAAAERAGSVRDVADRCRVAAETLTRYAVALVDAQSNERLVGSLWREAMDRERRASLGAAAVVDPEAGRLRDAAERLRVECQLDLDAAAYRAVVELSELAGRPAPRPSGSRLDTALDVVGLVPVIGDTVDLAHAGALYLQGDRAGALLTAAGAMPGPGGWGATTVKYAGKIPHGFRSGAQWRRFRRDVYRQLDRAGVDDAQVSITGSAVTGRSFKHGWGFDEGPHPSDFDLAIVSPRLWELARDVGIPLRGGGSRTAVLYEESARRLRLDEATAWLSRRYEREVSFMLYRDEQALNVRGAWKPVPPR